MKISLPKKSHLLIILTLVFYASISVAKGLTTKSMLVSASIPLIGGAYSYTNGDYEGLKELGLECALTAQIVTLLKNSVNRERPNGENNMSFPSGHTAAAFVGASYLHHRYGLVWGAPMYAIAGVIGYQRVNVKDHYWSDVIAGAAIGYAAGALFTARYPRVWVAPKFDPETNAFGLQMNAHFG
ncbi:MAG: phosphatase PAP2 family protein [Gammaproteobacteria bacterium]|nr:phosphatase PAP2 family protein [Gammaproteobacteria bacterium]